MKRIGFRIPDELLAAAEPLAAAAGCTSVGDWARTLIEKETGIHVEVKRGMGGADERTRRRVEKARQKGVQRAAAVRESTNGK